MAHEKQPLGLVHLRFRINRQYNRSLADYVLERHAADPDLTVNALAAELNVPAETWRRWLRRIGIGLGQGPRLVDQRSTTPSEVVCAADQAA